MLPTVAYFAVHVTNSVLWCFLNDFGTKTCPFL